MFQKLLYINIITERCKSLLYRHLNSKVSNLEAFHSQFYQSCKKLRNLIIFFIWENKFIYS